MFLSLRELVLRKLRFEETYSPGAIPFFDDKLRQITPMQVSGVAELLPDTKGEIRVRGHMEVCMEAECDRCLEPASFPIDVDFDLYYEPAASLRGEEDAEIDAGASEIGFYVGEGLELEDILREQVLLALPMQRICSQECKGICPICGQNRNFVTCNCRYQQVDDRWAALGRL
jgi:uncharacterized protein